MNHRKRMVAAFSTVARLGRVVLLVFAMVAAAWPSGARGEAAEARELRAGPVRVKLADGQLRYIRVGDKEIIRRIYFAVRDDHWRTPMPQFTEYRVEDGQDHF